MKGFTPTMLEEERELDRTDTFTVRLNREERQKLNDCKRILKQSKDSTVMKQLAVIGYNVLHDSLTGNIIRVVFKNKQRNERTGVAEID